MNDTIVAIATTTGIGAISIIKVSGSQAIKIVNSIFDRDLLKKESHTINYGYIKFKNELIDEVLISIMKAPKTFTMEDVVEINCHGGIIVTQKILNILLEKGCRLAEPGEFTKRAFLNGRINLMEAEAVSDLIASQSDFSRKVSINTISGSSTKKIKTIKDALLDAITLIEVNIDYPEYYDIEKVTNNKLYNIVNTNKLELINLYDLSTQAIKLKTGINLVLLGKPNVGKSSLLNKLLGEEKAIVTPIAGTTRDIVEGKMMLDNLIINVIDTAGIRKTDNEIEKIGVKKSYNSINKADLILVLLDSNKFLDDDDKTLLDLVKDKDYLLILTKNDLEKKINLLNIDKKQVVSINTKEETGITPLLNKIKEMYLSEKIGQNDTNVLTNARQTALLLKSINSLKKVEESIKDNKSLDIIELDLKDAILYLDSITGDVYQEDMLDKLFSNFCVGK